MSALHTAPLDILDAYRTCEFVTLGRNGAPVVWPAAVRRRADGTLLLTTSLAFAQKALNVRRDGRVALLWSDPTGSGLDRPPQIFVAGRAVCPDDVMTGPEGAEDYWRTLFERQPHSRSYLAPGVRRLMDWYYLRLLITVTPEQTLVRPPLAPPPPARPDTGERTATSLLGAAQLARYPSAVLAACDRTGAPVLARTRPVATNAGFAVAVPTDCLLTAGPASLLVHRHDERLNHMQNALVRGELRQDGGSWLLAPHTVVEPMGSGRRRDALRVLRQTKRATTRYLRRRGLPRPHVRWEAFRELATPDVNRMGS
ncbi:pyridoxamine 5'-phosphate oxidase [Streptomyces sp. NPDC000658]|uniref:pyridoxamine 5'-phosphate oxidase n=1 Tax=Streptomyces sp. NPDC000658 TaxID=3154266 RepID=UPI00331A41B3